MGSYGYKVDKKYDAEQQGQYRIHEYAIDRTNSVPHHVIVAKSHFDHTYSFSSSQSCQHGLESPKSGGVIDSSTSSMYSGPCFFSFSSTHISTSRNSNTHITLTNYYPSQLTMAKKSRKAPSRQHILDGAFAAGPRSSSGGPWTHNWEDENGDKSTTQYWLPGQDPQRARCLATPSMDIRQAVSAVRRPAGINVV